MGISSFYTSSATVKRETFMPASTVKKEFATIHSNVKCNFQAQSSEIQQNLPGGFGKQFLMFCAVIDIQEGDKITISSQDYGVEGVEKFEMGQNPHLRVTLTAFKS